MSITDITVYDGYLKGARSTAQTTKSALEIKLAQVNALDKVLSILSKIDTDADRLDKVAEGLKSVMKVVTKIGPLKTLARPLAQLLDVVEERAEEVRNSSKKLESKFKPLQDALDVEKAILNTLILTLGESVDQIDSVDTGVADAEVALSSTKSHLPSIFDTTIEEAAGTVSPVVDAGKAVDEQIDRVKDAMSAFSLPFDGWDRLADGLSRMFSQVTSIISSMSFLEGPLRAVQAAIRPIEWALDAIDFVFNLIVSPILDPILDALGVKALMDRVTDGVRALLPDVTIFGPLEARIDEIRDALNAPFKSLQAQIDELTDKTIGTLVLGPLNGSPTEGSEFSVGDDDDTADSGTTIRALGGNDIVSGGLGPDLLGGGDGNDILIGGEGNDTMDGGAGTDVAIFLGAFREYSFSFPQLATGADVDEVDVSRLVLSHVNPLGATRAQGTDTVINIEYIAFADVTFDFETFQNLKRSSSTTSTPQILKGTKKADILIGGDGIDTIFGKGGNDYIDGGKFADTIFGGKGDDLIDGGLGTDAVNGGPGTDTYTAANAYSTTSVGTFYIDLLNDPARRHFTPSEDVANIENVIGQRGKDYIWGSNRDNMLRGEDDGDRINGFGGDDIIEGGTGRDILIGGRGDDIVRGGVDADWFVGGPGDDRYEGGGQADLLFYNGGSSSSWSQPYAAPDDLANGPMPGLPRLGFLDEEFGPDSDYFPARVVVHQEKGWVRKYADNGALIGTDTIVDVPNIMGTGGNDRMIGDAVEVGELEGGDGNDVLVGGNSTISLLGGAGDDRILPGAGFVVAGGGIGDDRFKIKVDGEHSISGDAGSDTLDFSRSDREWVAYAGSAMQRGHFAGDIDPVTFGYRDVIDLGSSQIENIVGSRFNDLIVGDVQHNRLHGSKGNDTLIASSAPGLGDLLLGGSGDDQLSASGGDDKLFGGSGNDRLNGADAFSGMAGGLNLLHGEGGDDRFIPVAGGTFHMFGGEGADTAEYHAYSNVDIDLELQAMSGGSSGDRFDSVENLRGSSGADTLSGDGAGNRLTGEGGSDVLLGRGGNDLLHGNDGMDQLYGGDGDDLLLPGAGNDQLFGGTGTDTASFVFEQDGDDPNGAPDWQPGGFDGAVVADLLAGTAAFQIAGIGNQSTLSQIENLIGGNLDDILKGESGNNVLAGGAGDDRIVGRSGKDTLSGGDGADVIVGGGGKDFLVGGVGGDVLRGGRGKDTVTYEDASRGLVANLWNSRVNSGDAKGDIYGSIEKLIGSKAKDTLTGSDSGNVLTGLSGRDIIVGRAGGDVLQGDDGNDLLRGGSGHDRLIGGRNDDRLKAGDGRDKLLGGTGSDKLEGGKHADQFVFKSIADSPAKKGKWDTIVDFRRGQNDEINVRAIDARVGGKKNDSFTYIGENAFSEKKGELRIDIGKNTFVRADVDGDGKAEVVIKLFGSIDLAKGDFVL